MPKPRDDSEALTSTKFVDYPKSFYIVWIREKGNAGLFGTSKADNVQFDIIEVEDIKKAGMRPAPDLVNKILSKEGSCRQYNFTS